MTIKHKSFPLEIIGPTPPPYGGVSTHLLRLQNYLIESNLNFRIINQYKNSTPNIREKEWIYSLFTTEKKLHIHIFSDLLYPLLWLAKKINPKLDIIITIHNERLKKSRFRKAIFFFMKNTNYYKVISASKSIKDFLESFGIAATYLPAYVPPPSTSSINDEILDKRYTFHTCFNIWNFYDGSERDYGIDFLAELAEKHPSHAFYIFLGNGDTERKARQWLATKPKNIFLLSGKNLVSYLSIFDLFLRLNRLDAYGVSIQEALDSDVLAIATNVCTRPTGAILVDADSKNILDTYSELSTLESSERKQLAQSRRLTPEFHIDLIKIYQEFVKA
ncbi:hypothetical protein D3C75_763580 [compost metagenome]